jgi:hypothetical protein
VLVQFHAPDHRTQFPIEVENVPYLPSDARNDATASDSQWVKSSFSFANGDCVEVASLADGLVGVRDSKDSDGPVLRFTSSEWRAFVGGVRNGEFDV